MNSIREVGFGMALLALAATPLAADPPPTSTALFSNTQMIAVTNTSASSAEPYPATIMASGLENRAVVKVTVTLHGLSHTYPDDLDILLVGPHNQQVMLMSDAGGDIPATDLTLTFDDTSPSVLPDSGGLSGGAFRPHNYGVLPDLLSPPAPAAPHGTNLAVFNGTDPNGTWALYVRDDTTEEDVGVISGGWSLSLETELRPAGAALESGVYQTVPGATVEERGDRVPNGSRVVPFSATVTFDLSAAQPSLTALIPNAVLEGGDPFALTVRSSSGAQVMDGTYYFSGDYLRDIDPSGTQYGFDWRFSTSTNGVVWNGITGWAGGHIWQVTISNVILVPQAQLSISRAGTALVRITWATNFADHVLEYANSLPAAGWSTVTNATVTTGDRLSVSVNTGALQRFYRLRKP
jgi:subtilisin-like proprotein convertase family protein